MPAASWRILPMAKRMLIDATHPEETRVAVVDGKRLEEFDVEVASKKLLKGNIYLAKITRVEPSLQAAFVEYGGNRHGFLAFSEIHPDYYRIPVADRQALLAAEAAEDDAEEHSDRRGFAGMPREASFPPPLPRVPGVPSRRAPPPRLAHPLESRAAETQPSEPTTMPAAAENVDIVSAPVGSWKPEPLIAPPVPPAPSYTQPPHSRDLAAPAEPP